MKKKNKTYTIKRKESAYYIEDNEGNAVSHPDMWPITIKKLERLLRNELGI